MAAEDFINPIIKSMLANADYQQKSKQQQEEARSNLAAESFRQKQLDQAKSFHEDELKQAKARLDNETTLLNAQMDREHLEKLKTLGDLSAAGTIKPQNTPGAIGVQNFPGVEGQFPTGTFQTPEEAFAQKLKQGVDFTTATENAKEAALAPGREDAYKKAVAVAGIGANSREDVARTAAQTKMFIDQNRLDYQNQLLDLKRSQLLQGNANPDVAAKLYNDVYINGTTKFSTLNKNERQQVLNFAPPGHTPIDPKDNDLIDNIPKVQDILSTAQELSKYSLHPTSGNVVETLQGQFGLGGNQQQLKDSLKAKVDALVPIFAKVSRFSESTIKNQLEGLYSAGNSPQENANKVANAEQYLNSIVQPVLAKYPKDQVKTILSQRDIPYKGYTIPGTDSQQQAPPPQGNTIKAIRLSDGSHVAATPANRLKYGLPPE